jgi:hypothetical protein
MKMKKKKIRWKKQNWIGFVWICLDLFGFVWICLEKQLKDLYSYNNNLL